MGTKYSSQSISGYNSTPPPDDGSVSEANKVKWSTIKNKLTDPPKVLAEAVNTAINTALDYGPISVESAAVTLGASHNNQFIELSGASTPTLQDASTLGAGWFADVKNIGSQVITIARTTSTDTINDVTADITMSSLDYIRFVVNAAATGFNTVKTTEIVKFKKGADVASATALTLGNDGNYFDITGTTTITSIGTLGVGTIVKLHFDGALTLTHHATDLILPGGANITTAAGDEAEFIEYASGDWRCTNYQIAALPAHDDKIVPYSGANRVSSIDDGTAGVRGIESRNNSNQVEFAIDMTFGEYAINGIPASGSLVLDSGLFIIYNHTTTLSLEAYINGAWRAIGTAPDGSTWTAVVISDGTNVRITNSSGSIINNVIFVGVYTAPDF